MSAVPFQHADNEVRQRWNAHGESLRQDDAHIALELGHTKTFSGFLSHQEPPHQYWSA